MPKTHYGANSKNGEAALTTEQPCYPLDIYFCAGCGHVQLLDVVDPRLLFEDYAESVIGRFKPPAGSLAVDIGSNDATLLSAFQSRGMGGLGVDPARDIAARATEAGTETMAAFFTPNLTAEILDNRGPARIVTANNVFAHADDLSGIVEGVRTLLAPEGVFVFEVSYLADVIAKTLFDTGSSVPQLQRVYVATAPA